ncbi:alpha/beta hydrolase [Burkholderia ambifaria]|uniref:RBBP9/YdeN family alpha/beta hydrolase n=1 Tax=Burkholderia TaxID=32008 RepID=UPI00110E457A|nr:MULTISPECIES: alpha/beta hydrolase [Burkholderia]MBR8066728.1 alpha/beta hydrolase [Burkholderia ambifaria]MBR8179385.1 alpha/beta hydrolase [Burkholderia ambifaria]QDW50390.1 alpha/beta hydrolase [Burkholderia sp. KBS0801]
MTLATVPTILIVPGLRDHVEDHWQTHLQRRLPNARAVAPLEADKLSRAARVAALDAALAAIDGPVMLVAHSAGVMIVAHWALQATRAIDGALLAAPADLDTPMPAGYPTPDALDAHGWTPVPTRPLPFPSIVAASRNDPLARFERAEAFAAEWGSKLVDLGKVGHLNPASGYGEWHDAERLIGEVIALRAA